MRDIREYGNGPSALLLALTELGIDPQLVGLIPYENEAVRGSEQTWQRIMEQQVARPQEEMLGTPYIRRVILAESATGWQVIPASRFLTPVERLLTDQGITAQQLTRIVLVEHNPAEPWDLCIPHGAKPTPSFFLVAVAHREP